jgi:hypothetical protein
MAARRGLSVKERSRLRGRERIILEERLTVNEN